MNVFEVVVPGTWLDYDDRVFASQIEKHISSLQSQFYEANQALNLFIQAQQVKPPMSSMADREREALRLREIESVVRQEWGHDGDRSALSLEVETRFKREQWARGRPPRCFLFNLPSLYARSFLYALDGFDKFLRVLSEIEGVPGQIADSRTLVKTHFPHLRGVRDTSQHLEDRARHLGRDNKPLKLKPISTTGLSAPQGGVLVLGTLIGSGFVATKSDGRLGEVDVSVESMESLQTLFQDVLDAFNWRGAKQHLPS